MSTSADSAPLRTWDVVLLNVAAIIGLRWVSVAAAGGNVSITLWLLALASFFLPQAFAVIALTRRLPGDGGIYLWTKDAFGEAHGFLAGWCYWTNNLVYFPNLLVYVASVSVFVAGAEFVALSASKTYVLVFSLVVLWLVWAANFVGLGVGKWIQNLGGVSTWFAGVALVVAGIVAWSRFGVATPLDASSFFAGLFSREKLTFWSTICFAFAGMELASVVSGDVRDPGKTIPRAVILSGLGIAFIYVVGTFSLLVALPTSEINVITGFLQAIVAVSERIGFAGAGRLVALLVTLGGIGGLMAWFAGAARMPFVAGVDRFLPRSFGASHPKFGSPYVAITAQAVIATGFVLMSFIGAGVEEAYLVLLDTTLLVYFVPYLYMFGAYALVSWRRGSVGGLAAGSIGGTTTLIAMAFAVLPPLDTPSALVYELKVVGGFAAFLVIGGMLYVKGRR